MNQGLVLVAQKSRGGFPLGASGPVLNEEDSSMTSQVILKIEQCGEQVHGPVRKIIGLLGPKSFCHLIDVADLSANPRSAKRGSVTSEIELSLDETPELFPAKTKGILLASCSYRVLDRQRYQLTFGDTDAEGILDGGHNALAVGRHVLREAGLTNGNLKKVADWSEFVSAWKANRQAIADIEDVLNFQIPIEIQVPAHMQDQDVVDEFRTSLLEIGAARNNNVQLTDETKANKQGLYDELKGFLPADLADRVEWKANEGGEIKVREIVALSWIPLSKLSLPDEIRVNPNQIYRNKGVCVEAFNHLLRHDEVSAKVEGGYERELKNESIRSALRVSASLPDVCDQLVRQFPDAYNKAGGSFGRITAVKMFDEEKAKENNKKYLRKKPRSPFYSREMLYTCPDGFVVPFLYGMRALMQVSSEGIVSWSHDPFAFLGTHMVEVMRSYKLVIELGDFDPQKVGKNISAYQFAESAISAVLTKVKTAA